LNKNRTGTALTSNMLEIVREKWGSWKLRRWRRIELSREQKDGRKVSPLTTPTCRLARVRKAGSGPKSKKSTTSGLREIVSHTSFQTEK